MTIRSNPSNPDPDPYGYGAGQGSEVHTEARRWGVKVWPKDAQVQYLLSIQLPLPKIPLHGWVEPSVRRLDELPRYFQLTEVRQVALLFDEPNDALMEAFKIEEFGIEADVFEVDFFDASTELMTNKAG